MSNLDAYPEWAVKQAFRVHRKIKRDGLEGIGYMDAAHTYLHKNAADTTGKWIGFSLRNRGFK